MKSAKLLSQLFVFHTVVFPVRMALPTVWDYPPRPSSSELNVSASISSRSVKRESQAASATVPMSRFAIWALQQIKEGRGLEPRILGDESVRLEGTSASANDPLVIAVNFIEAAGFSEMCRV